MRAAGVSDDPDVACLNGKIQLLWAQDIKFTQVVTQCSDSDHRLSVLMKRTFMQWIRDCLSGST